MRKNDISLDFATNNIRVDIKNKKAACDLGKRRCL
jgi:hypothetical protein